MYVYTYEWDVLSLRREDKMLFFRMPSWTFFFSSQWTGVYAEHVQ